MVKTDINNIIKLKDKCKVKFNTATQKHDVVKGDKVIASYSQRVAANYRAKYEDGF